MKNYFSAGDAIDLFHLLRLRGLKYFVSGLKLSGTARGSAKWGKVDCSTTDFWALPEIQKNWNHKISGDENIIYEDYVYEKYLREKSNLKLLSVGCGNGSHEQNFAKYNCFESLTGIDVSERQIRKAIQFAKDDGLLNVFYEQTDFEEKNYEPDSFDLILFHSSLHHFANIEKLIKIKVLPILKPGGLVILFDYTGPNRLQWTRAQLGEMNKMLRKLPVKYRRFQNSDAIKKKVYRPGLFRAWLSDPTEARDSENILPSLNRYFKCLKKKN